MSDTVIRVRENTFTQRALLDRTYQKTIQCDLGSDGVEMSVDLHHRKDANEMMALCVRIAVGGMVECSIQTYADDERFVKNLRAMADKIESEVKEIKLQKEKEDE